MPTSIYQFKNFSTLKIIVSKMFNIHFKYILYKSIEASEILVRIVQLISIIYNIYSYIYLQIIS